MILSVVTPIKDIKDVSEEFLFFVEKSRPKWEGTVEFIFVLDGPPDASEGSRIKQTPNIWTALEKKSGANAARRIGLQMASGDFIHFHDSDDGFEENWVEIIISILKTVNNTIDIIITPRIERKHGTERYLEPAFMKRNSYNPSIVRQYLVFRNPIGPIGGLIFSRKLIGSCMLPDMPSSQDWFLYQCIYAKMSPNLHYESRTCFFYQRDRTGSISSSAWRKIAGVVYLCEHSPIRGAPRFVRRIYIINALYASGRIRNSGILRVYMRKTRLIRAVVKFLVDMWLRLVRRRFLRKRATPVRGG